MTQWPGCPTAIRAAMITTRYGCYITVRRYFLNVGRHGVGADDASHSGYPQRLPHDRGHEIDDDHVPDPERPDERATGREQRVLPGRLESELEQAPDRQGHEGGEQEQHDDRQKLRAQRSREQGYPGHRLAYLGQDCDQTVGSVDQHRDRERKHGQVLGRISGMPEWKDQGSCHASTASSSAALGRP
jgi:hypothetical protein